MACGLCATVYYTKQVRGRLYPKAARTGPYAYANEVSRVRGKVVSKYVGIVKIPEDTDVVEKGGEADADQFDESE